MRIGHIITVFMYGQVLPCSSLICKVSRQHWRWEQFLRKPSLWWCHLLTPHLAPDNLYLENRELVWDMGEKRKRGNREKCFSFAESDSFSLACHMAELTGFFCSHHFLWIHNDPLYSSVKPIYRLTSHTFIKWKVLK